MWIYEYKNVKWKRLNEDYDGNPHFQICKQNSSITYLMKLSLLKT